ncbi:MAG: leucine-rich repeat domain-containing protein [Ruminococcus sp.]|nr:leucine-rich repeat domain-containing protein [Ruminococcus sp.]
MKKHIISSLIALGMALGSLAVLPQSLGKSPEAKAAEEITDYSLFENRTDTFEYKDYSCCDFKDGTVGIIGYNGSKSSVTLPNKIDGKKVVYVLLDNIYYLGQDFPLESVGLPRYVKQADISLDKGVSSVNDKNKYFKSIDGILYSKDMKTLVSFPTTLKEYTIPQTVENIGSGAFLECSISDGFKLPASVKRIGYNAFGFCLSLTKLTLPDGLEYIGDYAFNTTELSEIVIPNTVTEIGYWAFATDSLKKVTIPDSVTKIDKTAFDETAVKNGLTIVTTKNSFADKFAKENGIKTSYKKTIALASVKVGSKTYTGKAIEPDPTVKFGTKTLKRGTDYTITYKNNKKLGRATMTIKGAGKYSGKLVKSFKIIPKKTAVKTLASTAAGKLKLSLKKVKGVTAYEITYSTSKKFTKKTTKTVSVKKLTKTISKLTSGKTCYVKVRSVKTVKGVEYKSKYSKVKKITVL